MIDGVRVMIDAEKVLQKKNGKQALNKEESKKVDINEKIE